MEGSFNGVVAGKVVRATEQTRNAHRPTFSKLPDAFSSPTPSSTNRNEGSSFLLRFEYLSTHMQLHVTVSSPQEQLIFSMVMIFPLICSLLCVRADPKSAQEQGLALRVLLPHPYRQYPQNGD